MSPSKRTPRPIPSRPDLPVKPQISHISLLSLVATLEYIGIAAVVSISGCAAVYFLNLSGC